LSDESGRKHLLRASDFNSDQHFDDDDDENDVAMMAVDRNSDETLYWAQSLAVGAGTIPQEGRKYGERVRHRSTD
jgi:hypothetical protein